jgi:CBS domain-containing protein
MTNRQMSEIIRRQEPTALRPTATVQEACRRMHERRIGAVLVTDEENRLLGIFTGRDAVRVLASARDRRWCTRWMEDEVIPNPGSYAMLG